MKLGKTSDAGPDTHVALICDELYDIFPELESKHRDVDLEIFWGFRALPDSLERRTFRRYSKKKNVLYLDMCVSADHYTHLSIPEQRFELSKTFLAYTRDSLQRYAFPGLDVEQFIADLVRGCEEIGWLTEPTPEW